jgi:hypothetical protein
MKTWLSNHFTPLFISIMAVISPAVPLLLTIGFLVVVDFIFAIYRQWKQDPKQITSRKMSNTITKLGTYTLTILAIFFLEKYILVEVLPITKIAAGLICLVELKSIDESFYILNKYSLWTKIIALIKRGESNTKSIIDVIDEKEK